ncbi:MAG: hypothetical protein VX874_19445 [Pseudomonadota bacterium]|nr:hypothetical protein [Pseudomonadota bacterium]
MFNASILQGITPPPPRDLAPAFITLATWSFFANLDPALLGRGVLPIWVALAAGSVIWIAGRVPDYVARAQSRAQQISILGLTALVLVAIVLAGLSPEAWMIQSFWIAGSILSGLLYSVMVLLGEHEDRAMLCPRWAAVPGVLTSALWVIGLRNAFFALAATSLMAHTTLTEWVVFVTLGRIGAYYIGEWVTVRMAMAVAE